MPYWFTIPESYRQIARLDFGYLRTIELTTGEPLSTATTALIVVCAIAL